MITSLDNSKIKAIQKLKQKKYRMLESAFMVEGIHMVEEAIKSDVCLQVFYLDTPPVFSKEMVQVSSAIMKQLTALDTPPPMIAIVQKQTSHSLSDRVLLLDGIQDPGNLGTLLRSAKAFGFHTIVYENTVDPYNPKVLRATQGAIFSLHLIESDLSLFIQNHPEYTYFGTTVQAGTKLSSYQDSPSKIALLLGNEGVGVRKALLEQTPINLTIEMNDMESLNVGVAGSILMYHLKEKE